MAGEGQNLDEIIRLSTRAWWSDVIRLEEVRLLREDTDTTRGHVGVCMCLSEQQEPSRIWVRVSCRSDREGYGSKYRAVLVAGKSIWYGAGRAVGGVVDGWVDLGGRSHWHWARTGLRSIHQVG
jgi:hypothetical protein